MPFTPEELRQIRLEDEQDKGIPTREDYRAHDVLQEEWRSLNRVATQECTTDEYTREYDLKHGGAVGQTHAPCRHNSHYSNETIQEIIRLHNCGMSIRKIAVKMGIPNGTVGNLYCNSKKPSYYLL